MRHFRSIRYKVIAVMLVIFLLFAVIVLDIWYHELRQEAETSAIRNAEHQLQVSNTIFENQVQDIINVTALTTVRSGNYLSTNILNIMSRDNLTDSEIVTYRKTATDYLISLCSFKKNLNGLMLSDFNGNNICYGVPTPYQMLVDDGAISSLLEGNEQNIFLVPHYPNQWYRTEKDLVFSVLRPVYGISGDKIGFAIADLSCQLFRDCYDAGSSSSLYVLNAADGKVLFSPAYDLLHMDSQSWAGNELTRHFISDSGHFFITNDSNEKLLAVYHKSDLTGWITLSLLPESEIIAAFTNTIREIMIITGMLVLLLILCVFFATSLLTKNIRILTNTVKSIDGTHLELSPIIHSNDEIGTLSLQFQAMLNRIQQLLREILEKESARHKAELSALQFQMNPHFLYNTLNTIKFLSTMQGVDNIGEVAEAISSLMHINMDGRAFLPVHEDIDFVRSYLKIQNYHYTNTFRHQIQVSPDCCEYLVPKLVIQPLAENALKHGLKDKSSGGILRIDCLIDGDVLKIIVEDNGCGMTDERIHEIMSENQSVNGGHIGIHNIQERIHMYFGPDYGIEILSQPDLFTRFEVTLPLVKTYEENAVFSAVPSSDPKAEALQ